MAKKGLIQEFKEFLTTGDLMSVAVAFIMGAAVKAVIDSFVGNIFTGILAMLLPEDKASFADITVGPKKLLPIPGEEGKFAEARPIRIGQFIDDIIKFVTLAFVVFMIVKAYKKFMNKQLAQDGPSTNDLLAEIRDSLKAGR
jgi:large conductance mechanosensitive channel